MGHKQSLDLESDLVGEGSGREIVLHMPPECEFPTVFLEEFFASCSGLDKVQVASAGSLATLKSRTCEHSEQKMFFCKIPKPDWPWSDIVDNVKGIKKA